jgi:hypothetical protein
VKIDVHIERLVLEGLPISAGEGAVLKEAIQRELARALAAGGLSHELRAGGAFPRMRAPGARLSSEPRAVGERVARSIYRGIGSGK